ncbi:hypothetical protein DL93DRAFT_1335344 [Clavulina sp. PMI_390]|nr:hypothetical protein DL93DRAFT_1335344 [Clavulina sp. PMI_390]
MSSKDPQKRYQTLAPPREVVYQLWMDEKGILDRDAQERQLTEDSLRTAKQEKRKATQEQLQKEQEKSHATKARVEAVRAQMRAKGMMVESSGSAMPNDKSTESANRPSSRNQPMAFPRYEPYGDKRKRQPANVFSDPRSKEAMDAAREAQRHWRPQSPERYTDTTALDYLDEGAWDETQQSTDRDRLYVAQIASLDPCVVYTTFIFLFLSDF